MTLTGTDELARASLVIPNLGGALHVSATANYAETDSGMLASMWLETSPSGDCDGTPLMPADAIFFLGPITIALCSANLGDGEVGAWALELMWFPTDDSGGVLPSPYYAEGTMSAADIRAQLNEAHASLNN